ncbi:MAG TPA: FtsX-like permease family protein, partial [Pirellulales bacterium]|nr:FtsX-like permease family protein [Pirellulales bacterium]
AIAGRTKDIGVLRIIGYRRGQILVSFLLESLLIAVVGGMIGAVLGYQADGLTATSIISSGQGGGKFVVLRLVVDYDILATAALFTLVMGGLGGLVPALSAMRLEPLESLR